MRRHTTRSRFVLVAAVAAAALGLLAAPAFAHVTANPGRAEAGDYARILFRVPHGCDGSPTTALTVHIPKSVQSVTPEFIPGWEAHTTGGDNVRKVTWTGGPPVPADRYFEFGLVMKLPDQPGETLYFPTVQACEQGKVFWTQTPAPGQSGHDLEHPAPSVALTAGPARTGNPAASQSSAVTAQP